MYITTNSENDHEFERDQGGVLGVYFRKEIEWKIMSIYCNLKNKRKSFYNCER